MAGACQQAVLPFLGTLRSNDRVTKRAAGPLPDGATIAGALELVAPRLRDVRAQRGLTLTELSERTGISKSTLSRLENGQRRPTLDTVFPPPLLRRGDLP